MKINLDNKEPKSVLIEQKAFNLCSLETKSKNKLTK